MASSTPHDLWACYQHVLDLYGRSADPHTRNLMFPNVRACLDLWFKAVERELRDHQPGAIPVTPQTLTAG